MKCYQLVEVAYQYESAIIPPASYEGAVASWRLIVNWLSRQPGWQLVETVEGKNETAPTYSTFKMPDGALYGLWVKHTSEIEPLPVNPPAEMQWLTRAPEASEAVSDYVVDVDRTPTDFLTGDELSDVVQQEAGV